MPYSPPAPPKNVRTLCLCLPFASQPLCGCLVVCLSVAVCYANCVTWPASVCQSGTTSWATSTFTSKSTSSFMSTLLAGQSKGCVLFVCHNLWVAHVGPVVLAVADAINAWIVVAVSNRSHIVAQTPIHTHTHTDRQTPTRTPAGQL